MSAVTDEPVGPRAEVIVHSAVILDGPEHAPAVLRAQTSQSTGGVADGWIAVADGVITARGRGTDWTGLVTSATVEVVDAAGARLAPAYVDMHCHGAGGFGAEDGAHGLPGLLGVHRAHGTGRIVLSFVADTVENLCRSLVEAARTTAGDPMVLGLHAEGPFLAPGFHGAHRPEALTAPTAEAVDRILAAADGALVQVTLAPELPGALEAISRFVSAGVKVAVGHTGATCAEAARAFDAGASILTHTFNGMPGIHHREPGPILAAVDAGHVTLELIADGVHVDPAAMRMIAALAPGRIALISDALPATGMGDGPFRLGGRAVHVEESIARVLDPEGRPGALAGSTLTLDRAVARAVDAEAMTPLEAVRAASLVPFRALGLVDRDSGALLDVGRTADFLLLDDGMAVGRGWIGGDPLPR
ncbi:N-acetylglucosamine 6-phosphate deacetylase [Brevibacterium sanguinis]|uniref:N-acetylglucosamine 6-phosphate deacetylase n=2 Tax=Brevibacterium TaxID=1696 RepID=A0A366IN61_9MICO|nr:MULTISPECIES: amidohydrolase family protein [Brevibacterium]RBP67080.1 N-acetylglucosamine 6-phosphate deacetylase [Brevibacterium sanguinis]RBP73605.1 N-acetylglucosamine 6-phosphate deacetylase [Brevibacterium celere]